MMSWLKPSATQSAACELARKGMTAIDARRPRRGRVRVSVGAVNSGCTDGATATQPIDAGRSCASCMLPTNRKPLPWMVRIRRCCSPVSPTARRTALMRLASVDSDTIRPPQTKASKSSLLTTRSRLSIRNRRRSNTWGSTCWMLPLGAVPADGGQWNSFRKWAAPCASSAARPCRISTLRHSRRRKKSRPSKKNQCRRQLRACSDKSTTLIDVRLAPISGAKADIS